MIKEVLVECVYLNMLIIVCTHVVVCYVLCIIVCTHVVVCYVLCIIVLLVMLYNLT